MKTLKTNKMIAVIAALIFVFSQIVPSGWASIDPSTLTQSQSVSTPTTSYSTSTSYGTSTSYSTSTSYGTSTSTGTYTSLSTSTGTGTQTQTSVRGYAAFAIPSGAAIQPPNPLSLNVAKSPTDNSKTSMALKVAPPGTPAADYENSCALSPNSYQCVYDTEDPASGHLLEAHVYNTSGTGILTKIVTFDANGALISTRNASASLVLGSCGSGVYCMVQRDTSSRVIAWYFFSSSSYSVITQRQIINISGYKTQVDFFNAGGHSIQYLSQIQYYSGTSAQSLKATAFFTSGQKTSYQEYYPSTNVMKRAFFYSNDILYQIANYDTAGKLVTVDIYNTVGQKTQHIDYWPSTNVKKAASFYENGILTQVINYDTAGKKTTADSYNGAGQKTQHIDFWPSTEMLKTVFFYENNILTQIANYDTAGKKSFVDFYNPANQKIQRIDYWPSTEVMKAVSFYSNTVLTRIENYDAAGKRTTTDIYSTSGQVTQHIEYWPSTDVMKVVTFYTNNVKTQIVNYDVAGKKTSSDFYSAAGQKTQHIEYWPSTEVAKTVSSYGNNVLTQIDNYDVAGKRTTTDFYNAAGQVTQHKEYWPSTNQIKIVYTFENQMTTQVDQYDAAGQLLSSILLATLPEAVKGLVDYLKVQFPGYVVTWVPPLCEGFSACGNIYQIRIRDHRQLAPAPTQGLKEIIFTYDLTQHVFLIATGSQSSAYAVYYTSDPATTVTVPLRLLTGALTSLIPRPQPYSQPDATNLALVNLKVIRVAPDGSVYFEFNGKTYRAYYAFEISLFNPIVEIVG